MFIGVFVVSSVLVEKFDLFLCSVFGFFNFFCVFLCVVREFFGFVFDFFVKMFEDREDRVFDGFFGFDVGVDNFLGVNVNVFEEVGDIVKGLVEVVVFFERLRDGLEEIFGLDFR